MYPEDTASGCVQWAAWQVAGPVGHTYISVIYVRLAIIAFIAMA